VGEWERPYEARACCPSCGLVLDPNGECYVCAGKVAAVPLGAALDDLMAGMARVRSVMLEAERRRARLERRASLRDALHAKRVRVVVGGQTIVSLTELQPRAWGRIVMPGDFPEFGRNPLRTEDWEPMPPHEDDRA